jgi:hypothetical protein
LVSRLQRWLLLAAPVLILGAALVGLALGWRWGQSECVAAASRAQSRAFEQAVADAVKQLQRGQRSAAKREAQLDRIDAFFDRLDQEAARDAPAAVDDCVLPAERLRRWAAANAGTADAGAAAGHPDGAAAPAAAAGVGADAGPGVQPPGGGAAVPPSGESTVSAAGAPGGGP